MDLNLVLLQDARQHCEHLYIRKLAPKARPLAQCKGAVHSLLNINEHGTGQVGMGNSCPSCDAQHVKAMPQLGAEGCCAELRAAAWCWEGCSWQCLMAGPHGAAGGASWSICPSKLGSVQRSGWNSVGLFHPWHTSSAGARIDVTPRACSMRDHGHPEGDPRRLRTERKKLVYPCPGQRGRPLGCSASRRS